MTTTRNINPDASRAANIGAAGATAATRADSSGNAPNYRHPDYNAQTPAWRLCGHMKGGTPSVQLNAGEYLPRMQNESPSDWQARVRMTFSSDHYATTLDDLVGLACSEDLEIGADVPAAIRELLQNIDGRGADIKAFSREFVRGIIDDGHAVLFSDYPAVPDPTRLSLQDVKDRRIRPFVSIRHAQDVISWRTIVLGGEEVLVQVVFRETARMTLGTYGTTTEDRYRVLRQIVTEEQDPSTGESVAVGLGAMSWELWRGKRKGEKVAGDWVKMAGGDIEGPQRLPVRVAYGADQLGVLSSRPFLLPLAFTQLEEVQVKSEYANIMHKCNVPTPVFIGRPRTEQGSPVVMGEGIDVPIGGDAKIMEPQGNAIGATRDRLNDLQHEARRQGATLHTGDETKMTATEAAIAARQRNARLAVVVDNANNALEGMVADLAAFMGVTLPEGEAGKKGGGTIRLSTDFASAGYDAAFVAECRAAWEEDAIPLEAYLHVLKTGSLPDDFDVEAIAITQAVIVQEQRDAEAATTRMALQGQMAGANAGDPMQDDPGVPAKGKRTQKTPPSVAKPGRARNATPGDAAGKRAAKRSQGV